MNRVLVTRVSGYKGSAVPHETVITARNSKTERRSAGIGKRDDRPNKDNAVM
jgi:hypothetical protein